jgi:uncharacterized protein DUF2848
MLRFERAGTTPVEVTIHTLIIAGWTGRDEAALRHHVEELAALGVPAPSSMPVFYRVAAANLTQDAAIQVLGPDTSGEAEPAVVSLVDGLWLGLGSDHTDRKAETAGIALSKQLCPKPVGTALWRLEEVLPHWDRLLLTSTIEDGIRYQHGALAAMRAPDDLLARGPALPPGSAMFCGTLGAIGGIRPSARFAMELHDPVLGRTLRHAYDVQPLPVIA